jgi:hypothetical protein
MIGKAVRRHGAHYKQRKDGPAGWIGYGLENISSHLICNHLIANINATIRLHKFI